jgi:hypothetical protein
MGSDRGRPGSGWRNEGDLFTIGILFLVGGFVYLFWIFVLTAYTCPPQGCLSSVQQTHDIDAIASIPVFVIGAAFLAAAAALRRSRQGKRPGPARR